MNTNQTGDGRSADEITLPPSAPAWLALALCVVGAFAPYGATAMHSSVSFGEVTLRSLVTTVLLGSLEAPPLIGLGLTAWTWRRNPVASAVIALAAAMSALVGWSAFWSAAQDPKGIELGLTLLWVPLVQALIWACGHGVVSLLPTRDERPR